MLKLPCSDDYGLRKANLIFSEISHSHMYSVVAEVITSWVFGTLQVVRVEKRAKKNIVLRLSLADFKG